MGSGVHSGGLLQSQSPATDQVQHVIRDQQSGGAQDAPIDLSALRDRGAARARPPWPLRAGRPPAPIGHRAKRAAGSGNRSPCQGAGNRMVATVGGAAESNHFATASYQVQNWLSRESSPPFLAPRFVRLGQQRVSGQACRQQGGGLCSGCLRRLTSGNRFERFGGGRRPRRPFHGASAMWSIPAGGVLVRSRQRIEPRTSNRLAERTLDDGVSVGTAGIDRVLATGAVRGLRHDLLRSSPFQCSLAFSGSSWPPRAAISTPAALSIKIVDGRGKRSARRTG